ncbi:hypothetical protein PybrP1_000349 [[Pythium] brassicae (nom. inval.)]|nr:hypothetical protein PybrP1_000349 [[Pythium] brassicae (nom. inval.)]
MQWGTPAPRRRWHRKWLMPWQTGGRRLCALPEAERKRPRRAPLFSDLDNGFTENEVRRATRSCKRGKAVGPDGLGNDWYRDDEGLFTPLLARLFDAWWTEGVVLATFLEANTACLRKTKASAAALDYRLIVPLNSDYKIYTRVLANRLQTKTGSIVSPTQSGANNRCNSGRAARGDGAGADVRERGGAACAAS